MVREAQCRQIGLRVVRVVAINVVDLHVDSLTYTARMSVREQDGRS
jgi:hypothetical protein